jgi:Cof subfamily protein (haloacid dehalogenase superfamily)
LDGGSEVNVTKKFLNVRLVVTDLDGTLLSSDKTISPENLAAVRKLQDRGIIFTFASGRMSQMLEAYVKQLSLDVPIIACDGAKIINVASGEILHHQFLDADEAEDLLDFASANQMDYVAFTLEKVYFSPGSKRTRNFIAYNEIAVQIGTDPMPLYWINNDHHEIAQAGILKILIVEKSGSDLDRATRHIAACSQIYAEMPELNVIDILEVGTSKGDAVSRLARMLQIDLSEVCVFGDYLNDISMMQAARYSFAMANAVEEVKDAAMALTESNDNSGFAKAIEQYIL